jgi:diguanylate cyclase (GGDEF)-like protein
MHVEAVKRAPVKRLIALGCALTLCFSAICAYVIANMANGDYEQARIESQNLVATIAADIARHIDTIDQSLQAVENGLKLPAVSQADPALRNMILFDRAANAPDVVSTLVLDKNGNVEIESHRLEPRPDNYAQRDFFQHHRDHPTGGLYVSAPWQTQGEHVVGVSRRLDDADGRFIGVVVTLLRVSYFYNLLQTVAVAPGDNISVFRLQGTLLMRFPYNFANIGRDLSNVELFSALKKAPSGSYELQFPTDNIRRLATYHKAGNSPLVVTAGRSIENIYADWRHEAWSLGSVIFALCVFNLGLIVFLAQSLKRRATAEQKLSVIAATDSLTGICNRRRFDEILDAEWRRAHREQSEVAMILIDADNFKMFNDEFGHQAGDALLATLANCIDTHARRPADLAARYGGEEFAVLLPGTSSKAAFDFAERIRASILALPRVQIGQTDVAQTVSIGVAAMVPRVGLEPRDLVEAADRALYAAKAAGRNRSIAAPTRIFDVGTRAA